MLKICIYLLKFIINIKHKLITCVLFILLQIDLWSKLSHFSLQFFYYFVRTVKIGAVNVVDDVPLSTATLKCLTSQEIANFMFKITP